MSGFVSITEFTQRLVTFFEGGRGELQCLILVEERGSSDSGIYLKESMKINTH